VASRPPGELVYTAPLPELSGETREVVHPILRHQDHSMYFRQVRDAYAIGNYRHEPRLTEPEDAPQPAEQPFTEADFVTAAEEAGRLLPALRGPRSCGRSLWGQDIDEEHDPYEAGLGWAVRLGKGADFIGRGTAEKIRARGVSRLLACMVVDDPSVVLVGKEPILDGDRAVGYVTSAGYGATAS
jgi:Glycine cleavage T-protein C-terminal barrel domain